VVVLVDGEVYDGEAISKWIDLYGTSPVSGMELTLQADHWGVLQPVFNIEEQVRGDDERRC
jgi:hypothetical protein